MAVKGIIEWLASIGLSEYAETFIKNAADPYDYVKARFVEFGSRRNSWLLSLLRQVSNRHARQFDRKQL